MIICGGMTSLGITARGLLFVPQAGWTVNELGQRTNDYVAGIYTFGSILGTEELSLR